MCYFLPSVCSSNDILIRTLVKLNKKACRGVVIASIFYLVCLIILQGNFAGWEVYKNIVLFLISFGLWNLQICSFAISFFKGIFYYWMLISLEEELPIIYTRTSFAFMDLVRVNVGFRKIWKMFLYLRDLYT